MDTWTREVKVAKLGINNEGDSVLTNEEKILKILNELNNNSCIRYYASGYGLLTRNNMSVKKFYIIMEYGSKGDLVDRMENFYNEFSEEVFKYILYQILKRVKDLHSSGICHRDIKPENIVLVGDEYDIKLCDLGYAGFFINKKKEKFLLKERLGTESYAAPEILIGQEYDGEMTDVFSIGLTILSLMSKKLPFNPYTKILRKFKNSLNYFVSNYKTQFIEEYFKIIEETESKRQKKFSEEFKDLIKNMLEPDPKQRISLDEIMNSECMKEYKCPSSEFLENIRNEMIIEIEKTYN